MSAAPATTGYTGRRWALTTTVVVVVAGALTAALMVTGVVAGTESSGLLVFGLATLVARELVERWWDFRVPAERRRPPRQWESAMELLSGVGFAAYGLVAIAAAEAVSTRDLLLIGLGAFFLACWFADRRGSAH